MKLFALNSSEALGRRTAEALGRELAPHEEREFSYGEHKARPLVEVRGEDCYVLSSLHGDRELSVNDKLCRLLFFAGALKDAGACRVTALVPFLAYSRKDRRTKPQDPVTTRYVATVLESVGVDRLVTVDVHNAAALENAFRRPAINLGTHPLFVEHCLATAGDVDSIVSPDLGGLKSTRAFADALAQSGGRQLPLAVMDKRRSEGRVSGTGLVGDVGRFVLIVDDMIDSGTTLCRAAQACLDAGAERIAVFATHGLFGGGAPALFEQPGISSISVTDTVALDALELAGAHRRRITTTGVAPLLADCVRQMQDTRDRN